MLSDTLYDAAAEIEAWREDFPEIYGDRRLIPWLDSIAAQLRALGEVCGAPPPPDDRTHKGECLTCHEITTIHLDTLVCEPCAALQRDRMNDLLAAVGFEGDPFNPDDQAAHSERVCAEADAEMAAARAEWLTENTLRIVTYFRKLRRADRDHILTALHKQLLEAR